MRRLLRLWLWSGVSLSLVCAVALGHELLRQSSFGTEPGGDAAFEGAGAAAQVGLLLASTSLFLASAPLLVALRRGSARWGALGLGLAAALAAAVPTLFLVDARDPPGCPEGTLGGYVAPAWFLSLLFVATSRDCLGALGLGASAAARALARLVRVALAALALVEGVALFTAELPSRRSLEALAPGLERGALLRLLEPHCSVATHPGRALATCRAVVPALLRCAPAPAQRVALELDEQGRLVRWRQGWTIAGACAPPSARGQR